MKKALLESAAHLWVCSCGEHGHVVLPDGTELPDFWCKKFGRTDIESVLGRITPENAVYLLDQLEKSTVPEDDCGLTLRKRAEVSQAATAGAAEITLYICPLCSSHGHMLVGSVAESECMTKLGLRNSLAKILSKRAIPTGKIEALGKEIASCPLPEVGNTFELMSYVLTYHNLHEVGNRIASAIVSMLPEEPSGNITKH